MNEMCEIIERNSAEARAMGHAEGRAMGHAEGRLSILTKLVKTERIIYKRGCL